MAEVTELHKKEAPEAPASPFPASCKARFPVLDVFGQIAPDTDEEALSKFLTEHGLEVEFSSKNVQAQGEGMLILKVKSLPQTAIIPFGMLFAMAEGASDFMVIHPQVFLTFYKVDEPAPAASSTIDGGVLQ